MNLYVQMGKPTPTQRAAKGAAIRRENPRGEPPGYVIIITSNAGSDGTSVTLANDY